MRITYEIQNRLDPYLSSDKIGSNLEDCNPFITSRRGTKVPLLDIDTDTITVHRPKGSKWPAGLCIRFLDLKGEIFYAYYKTDHELAKEDDGYDTGFDLYQEELHELRDELIDSINSLRFTRQPITPFENRQAHVVDRMMPKCDCVSREEVQDMIDQAIKDKVRST